MSKPKRIRRRGSKGWKMPANAIYVGRPTVWGNPYVVGSELMNGETLTAEKAVELYEQHLADNFSERDIRHCLHDKDLACWCALDEPCHADVLLRIANSRPKFQRKYEGKGKKPEVAHRTSGKLSCRTATCCKYFASCHRDSRVWTCERG